ncbi:asparagine synthase (glutamine-hydrolysing) [Aestuariispira insulae]|uniref:asparagine synthase (glutamine-hydrolyzing) n=2 Tax=Aestuariispira insulae TaxID=1461337 RepID=A0A3D9HMV4_9PROT|nr:asparagine synthase (glutamine-hydrolysing) [Aestuariispira insulae]
MESHCERYVIAFNGEIYNHEDLRRELEQTVQVKWRGHSDTETLLTAIACWGPDVALTRLDGMFAFALWDRRDRTMFFARDRFGEKPLYWGLQGGCLYFGSELKAMPELGLCSGDLDEKAIAQFFRYRYIPAPQTIFKGVNKLRAGEVLKARWTEEGLDTELEFYWRSTCEASAVATRKNPADSETVENLLKTSVEGRLNSDVPLGAFLSGGIDSSLTVALARQLDPGLKTYTIRFEDSRFNEADHAMAVARHLETDHHELTVTEQDALACVASLSSVYDEPFADPSQIPTILLCRKAKEHVTVALSGDGGDEFFAGYSRYARILNRWEGRPPAWMRKGYAWASSLPVSGLGKSGEKIFRTFMNGRAETLEEYAQNEVGFWRSGVPVRDIAAGERHLFLSAWPGADDLADFDGIKRQMISDAMVYLPDDLQVKVDRAAMACSLEVRTPFLNQQLARAAWSISTDNHMDPTHGSKSILKQILYRHVPRELVDRPKQGFDVPLREWLRGALKSWGEELLNECDSTIHDIVDVARIRRVWAWHQAGGRREGDLWPALVFLDWWRRWQA